MGGGRAADCLMLARPFSVCCPPLLSLLALMMEVTIGAPRATERSQLLPFSTTYDIQLASHGYFDEGPGLIVGWFPAASSNTKFPLFVLNPGTGTLPNMTYAKAIT